MHQIETFFFCNFSHIFIIDWIDELGKILVLRKQQDQTALPNTMRNEATDPLLDPSSMQKNRPNQTEPNGPDELIERDQSVFWVKKNLVDV